MRIGRKGCKWVGTGGDVAVVGVVELGWQARGSDVAVGGVVELGWRARGSDVASKA